MSKTYHMSQMFSIKCCVDGAFTLWKYNTVTTLVTAVSNRINSIKLVDYRVFFYLYSFFFPGTLYLVVYNK